VKTKLVFMSKDKELIKMYLLKGYRPVKLMTKFLKKTGKRNGLDKLLKLCETDR